MPSTKERLKWFNDQCFGMLIHWGLCSITSKGEWYRYKDNSKNARVGKQLIWRNV
jgi:alpha-L-fucosidase